MKSLVRIYKTGIIEERNMIIDDIEEYLTHQTLFYSSSDFQYIKQTEMYISIKIDKPATYIDNTENYNYCVIQNYTDGVTPVLERKYYYFVESSEWKSSNTIKLNLKLDVLNTFKLNTDYTLSPFTRVLREHKDRISKIGLTNNYKRIVDKYDEGINGTLFRKAKETFYDTSSTSWSLVYVNNDDINPSQYNQVNPINSLLVPNDVLEVNYFNCTTNVYDWHTGYWQVFSPKYNTPSNPNGLRIRFKYYDGGQLTTYYFDVKRVILDGGGYDDYVVLVRSDSASTEDYLVYRRERYNSGGVLQSTLVLNDLHSDGLMGIDIIGPLNYTTVPPSIQNVNYSDVSSGSATTPSTAGSNHAISMTYNKVLLNSIKNFDKTNSKIVKIIKLPYCPIELQRGASSLLTFENGFAEYDDTTQTMKLIGEYEFKTTITTDEEDMFSDLTLTSLSPLTNENRRLKDSKLWNSAFQHWKFAYDSFAKVIAFEDLNVANINLTRINVYFKMTKTLNSRFLFHLYDLDNYMLYSQEDYDNLVSVARSNEETIYSSQYLNYLRNGYNYDVKQRNRNLLFGGLNLALGGIGSVLGLGDMAQTKEGITASGGYGIVSGQVSGVLGFIKGAIDSQQAMEQKQEQMKAQATSVSGSDDIDLLEYYNGNKAYIFKYKVSDRMYDLVDNLFYYCGYATNEMKVPSTNTRIWWNFIQANLVYKACNFEKSYQVEMSNKWANGITIYHKRSNAWDLEQVKENWETSIF